MIKKIGFVLLLCFVTCALRAQQGKSKIKEVISKDTYNYIPLNYLTDSVKGLVMPIEFYPSKDKKKNYPVGIFWNSWCIDGRYEIKITPEQIYLISSHENPNPNFLYWVMNIDIETYNILKKKFLKLKPWEEDIFYNSKYDKREQNDNCKNSDNYMEEYTQKVIKLLNSYIKEDRLKIRYSQRVQPMTCIYLGHDFEEVKNLVENTYIQVIEAK